MWLLLFYWYLVVGLRQVHFAVDFGSIELGSEVPQVWDRMHVCQSLFVELAEVPAWTVCAIWLWLEVEP